MAIGTNGQAWLGHVHAQAGETEKALNVLSELEERSKERYVPSDHFAIVHIGLGQNDDALKRLEKGYEEHSGWMAFLNVEPVFDPLRDDPRFQDLLRRMNFPE